MPRSAVNKREARQIRSRLHQFVEEVHEGNWEAFQHRVEVERTTVSGWKKSVGLAVPDGPNLLKLARYGRMSLNWLLLGEGPMLCGEPQSARSQSERLRAALVAQFAATVCADVAEAERCVPDAQDVWTHVISSLRPIVIGTRVIIRQQEPKLAILIESLIEGAAAGNPTSKKLVQLVAERAGMTKRELDRVLRAPDTV